MSQAHEDPNMDYDLSAGYGREDEEGQDDGQYNMSGTNDDSLQAGQHGTTEQHNPQKKQPMKRQGPPGAKPPSAAQQKTMVARNGQSHISPYAHISPNAPVMGPHGHHVFPSHLPHGSH